MLKEIKLQRFISLSFIYLSYFITYITCWHVHSCIYSSIHVYLYMFLYMFIHSFIYTCTFIHLYSFVLFIWFCILFEVAYGIKNCKTGKMKRNIQSPDVRGRMFPVFRATNYSRHLGPPDHHHNQFSIFFSTQARVLRVPD